MNNITSCKRFLGAIFLLIGSLAAVASPARRIPFLLRLADGSEVEVVKRGDESAHWLETSDGSRMVVPCDGGYRLASLAERDSVMSVRMKAPGRRRTVGSFKPKFPTSGNMRSLILLVNFTDVKMNSRTAHDDFFHMMNDEGYSLNGGTGSARDYYVDNSMGVFQPDFDVVGPITLSHGYAYYGENDNTGEDLRATDMIIEACQLADDEVDFTKYDYNNDGFIDNVFVFYAGYGEATTSDANTVWPHSFDVTSVTSLPVILDGKRLDHYACTNELSSDGRMDGIGTFVHEFGHVLGLMDHYATSGSTAFTPNTWDVMDEGEYNNESRTPPCFTAYERYCLGWLNLVEISDAASVCIEDVSTNTGYVINTDNPNEYFILENRQRKGWDRYIPGHGMLVWHIDYDEYLWDRNRINNEGAHQHIDIVEADGIASTGTKDGDAFPGMGLVTSFTATTTPAFVTWDGKDVGVPLTNIREEGGLIYLDACGGGPALEPIRFAVPNAMEAEEVGTTSFMARWESVDEAEGYYVGLGTLSPGEKQEDVATFDGGVSKLPEQWTTSSISTYSNASYAGKAIPSLRLQKDGDYLECLHEYIYSIEFWCRCSSVKAATSMEVSWLQTSGEWTEPEVVKPASSATTLTFSTPGYSKGVRITYHPGGGGSLALDDVAVTYADLAFSPVREEEYTTGTSMLITDLTPGQDYAYYVVAAKGVMRSRRSNLVSVTTDTSTGIVQPTEAAAAKQYYNLQGQRVNPDKAHGIIICEGRKIFVK